MKKIGYRTGFREEKSWITGIGYSAKNIIQRVCADDAFECILLEYDQLDTGILSDGMLPLNAVVQTAAGYKEDFGYIKTLPLQCLYQDVGLVHSFFEPCFTERGSFAKVLTLHDLTPVVHPEWYREAVPWTERFRRAAQNADRIIADSEYTKQDVVKYFNLPPDKIKVIYLGLNTELHQGGPGPENIREKYRISGDYLLSVCMFNPRKNLSGLIRAFDLYQQRHADSRLKLVLTGPTGLIAEDTFAALEKCACRQDIILTGYVPDADLAGLYENAFAVAYPSFYEGFGLPVLEAMAYGKAVIASDRTSIPEVGGDAVEYCNPDEIDSITAAIEKLIDNPAHRKRLEQAAIRQAARFSYDRAAKETMEVYRELLA